VGSSSYCCEHLLVELGGRGQLEVAGGERLGEAHVGAPLVLEGLGQQLDRRVAGLADLEVAGADGPREVGVGGGLDRGVARTAARWSWSFSSVRDPDADDLVGRRALGLRAWPNSGLAPELSVVVSALVAAMM
jgi:hypothetical protein